MSTVFHQVEPLIHAMDAHAGNTDFAAASFFDDIGDELADIVDPGVHEDPVSDESGIIFELAGFESRVRFDLVPAGESGSPLGIEEIQIIFVLLAQNCAELRHAVVGEAEVVR